MKYIIILLICTVSTSCTGIDSEKVNDILEVIVDSNSDDNPQPVDNPVDNEDEDISDDVSEDDISDDTSDDYSSDDDSSDDNRKSKRKFKSKKSKYLTTDTCTHMGHAFCDCELFEDGELWCECDDDITTCDIKLTL